MTIGGASIAPPIVNFLTIASFELLLRRFAGNV
jgi:hypothetical protein